MTAPPLPFPVAILAGGLATRLRPLTEKIPKILLPVAGQPFLVHQLRLLREQGITEVVLCVGHLGEQIQDAFGHGEQHGVRLRYSFDGPTLLGTGGALKKALPLLGPGFFVLYGDSYLPTQFSPIAAAFTQSGKPGLMTVYHNQGKYDTSNVWFEDDTIKLYDKTNHPPQMRHIDYGLSLFQSSAFDCFTDNATFDLATLMQRLVNENQMAGFEVAERFYEIGSPSGLQELETLLKRNVSNQ